MITRLHGKVKLLVSFLFLFCSLIGFSAEPSFSIAVVHPESRSILAKNEGKVPEGLREGYRLLFELNSGTDEEKIPLENGLLVSKTSLLDEKDFIGHEHFSTAFGNLIGVLHLRLEPRDKLLEFLHGKSKVEVALVIDNDWVFCTTGIENISPERGYVVFGLFDRLDERVFQLLMGGKRGKALEDGVEKYYEEQAEIMSRVPSPTPIPQAVEEN